MTPQKNEKPGAKDDHSYHHYGVPIPKKDKVKEDPQPVLCVECGSMFNNQILLDKHILVKHTKTLICEKCGFGTGCKDELSK